MADKVFAYSAYDPNDPNDPKVIASASISSSGRLDWSPAAPDFSQCRALQITEQENTPQELSIWFVVDFGSVTLDSNNFPKFVITTPLCALTDGNLTFSNGQWNFHGSNSESPAGKKYFSFAFPADKSGPPPAAVSVSVQFTPNLSSDPADVQIDVNSGTNTPWDIYASFVGETYDNKAYLILSVSTQTVNLTGNMWAGFGKRENFAVTCKFLRELAPTVDSPHHQILLDLSSFSNVANYWNTEIARPYLLSVPTAEPDAPLSAIWTISTDEPWSYRAYVRNLGLNAHGDFALFWEQGCFTLQDGVSIDFELPDFLVHAGGSFQGKATLLPATPDKIDSQRSSWITQSNAFQSPVVAFRVATLQGALAQQVRVGALDFAFGTRNLTQPNFPWHVLGYVEPRPRQRPRIVVQDLELAIDSVEVGSQDPLPNQTGEPALVIPSKDSAQGQYALNLAESNPFGKQRNLTLSLYQNQSSEAEVSLLILDRNPFLVSRVKLPSLLASVTGSNQLVAEWSNTYAYGEGWHSQSGAQTFSLLLPSQGIGEAIERNKLDGAIIPGSPIDYRFSPATQVQVSPPSLAGETRTYFEAPWNLRRLLVSPGQNVPGSLLPSFIAEFAYGMPVSVQSANLRLAEISALTGRLASSLASRALNSGDLQKLADDWEKTLVAFQTRLSVLLPWDGMDPGSLQLSDEAQYQLRSSADLAVPAEPLPGLPPPPYPSGSLKGGISWIFESENIYRGIWQRPQSTSALLVDPALSALGGWAKQRAVFLNGLTTIDCHVEMGRVSSISVEQLGRIGVLWNHAKLVTVFERTVQPSDQFANSQDLLLGQPIIRKVRQYVELLQPTRSYPESGAGAIDVAFVQGSEFKTKIISVDAAWGSDIPGGWQVPLWKPDADPSVYVKPHILVQLAVDPNTGTETQSQEIAEPQKLLFYTTEGAGPDPDIWPSVLNVDFADVDTTLENNQNYRLSIQPGMGAFTWSLAPAPFRTNLVAQRTSSSMNAALSNVSMMRSKPKPNPPHVSPTLDQVRDQAAALIFEIGANLPITGPTSDFQNILDGRQLKGYVDQLVNTAAAVVPTGDPKAAVQTMVGTALANFQEQMGSAEDVFASVVQQIQSAVSQGASNIVAIASAQNQVLNSLLGDLQPDTVTENLKSALTSVQSIDTAIPTDTQIKQAFQAGKDATIALLTPLQTTVVQSVQTIVLNLAPFSGIGASQLSPGWLQTATIEAYIAQPISDLLNNIIDISTAAGQKEVKDALTSLAQDGQQLTQVVTALKSLQFNLDPASSGASPLAKIQSLSDAQNWLNALGSAPSISQIVANAGKALTDCINQNGPAWIPAINATQSALKTIGDNFANLLQTRAQLSKDWSAFPEQLNAFQFQLQSTLENFLAANVHLANTLPTPVTQSFSQADQVLRLFRAYGSTPDATGLSFSQEQVPLDQLVYFFDGTRPDVPITSDVQSTLQGLGQTIPTLVPINLNVPIQSLLDRLVPDPSLLEDTISSIFKNLAGMDLSALFSGLMPPLNAPDGIQIRHSINPQTLQVEVDADIDIKFTNDAVVMDFGPVILRLLNARFQASVKIQAQEGNQPVQQVTGTISGNWELQIAGLSLVTFVNTTLAFDQSGHIRFDVSPDRVQLASVMQFIADLVNSIGSPGSGLTVRFTPSPVAVVSNLDLPLPDIAGGVFALSNVRLGAQFGIGLDPQNHFTFNVGLNLSREDAPFAIVIFILGGGGWVDAQMTYTIGASPIVSVTVGISAVASLEISLGPISGGVMVSFSLFATYSSGASLDLGIVICVAGHVSLLGIVDADITLLLEADYDQGQLTGRGSVSVDIQICWCFTLSIHQEVEYHFGNPGHSAKIRSESARADNSDSYWNAASTYIDMLAA